MNTERLGIRVTPDLKAALTALATADGRTLSSYIERILTAHVAASKG